VWTLKWTEAAEMRFLRSAAGVKTARPKKSEVIKEELQVNDITDTRISDYRSNQRERVESLQQHYKDFIKLWSTREK
jgi:hypothetical protein